MRSLGSLYAGLVLLVAAVSIAVLIAVEAGKAITALHEQQELYEKARYLAGRANVSTTVIELPEPVDLVVVDPNGMPHVARRAENITLPWRPLKAYIVVHSPRRVAAADPAAAVASAPLTGGERPGATGYLDPWLVEAYRVGLITAEEAESLRGVVPRPTTITLSPDGLWYPKAGSGVPWLNNYPDLGEALSWHPWVQNHPYPWQWPVKKVAWYYNVSGDEVLVVGFATRYPTARTPLKAVVFRPDGYTTLPPCCGDGVVDAGWLHAGRLFYAYKYKPEESPIGSFATGAIVAWNETIPVAVGALVSLASQTKIFYKYDVKASLALIPPGMASAGGAENQDILLVKGATGFKPGLRELAVYTPTTCWADHLPQWAPCDTSSQGFQEKTVLTAYILVYR